MNWTEWTTIVGTPILTLLGVFVTAFLGRNWIADFLTTKYIEQQKHEMQQELESYKVQLNNSVFLFQKLVDASSAFNSLHEELRPYYRFPDMDSYDADEEFALRFEEVGNSLDSYIKTHGAFIEDETLERLKSAKSTASLGNFSFAKSGLDQGGLPMVTEEGRQYARQLMNTLEEIEKELRQKVRSQSST